MIKIFTSSNDITSDEVQSWLEFFGYKVSRENDFPFNFENQLCIQIGSKDGSRSDLTQKGIAWYRRTGSYANGVANAIQSAIDQEYRELKKHFTHDSNYNFAVNKPSDSTITKIEMLRLASEHGIDIPETLITNSREKLLAFSQAPKKIIVKPLSAPLSLQKRKNIFNSYTRLLDKQEIIDAPKNFTPSIFQEYIDKEYEIRSFYLSGQFYSMAIFSQSDSRTAIDFRHYRLEKPNRQVPFKLPVDIEQKLKALMESLDMESGSLDVIFDKYNRFVFLEVNPVGQFGMVSEPCNYYLEKKVAEFLIEKHEKEIKRSNTILL